MVKYFSLAVVQMLCSATLITVLVKIFPFGMELVFKVIVDTILFFVSYSIQQKLIFQRRKRG